LSSELVEDAQSQSRILTEELQEAVQAAQQAERQVLSLSGHFCPHPSHARRGRERKSLKCQLCLSLARSLPCFPHSRLSVSTPFPLPLSVAPCRMSLGLLHGSLWRGRLTCVGSMSHDCRIGAPSLSNWLAHARRQRLAEELSEGEVSARDREALIQKHELELKAIEAQLAMDSARQQASLEQQLAARRYLPLSHTHSLPRSIHPSIHPSFSAYIRAHTGQRSACAGKQREGLGQG
jgi:hypothetical protein